MTRRRRDWGSPSIFWPASLINRKKAKSSHSPKRVAVRRWDWKPFDPKEAALVEAALAGRADKRLGAKLALEGTAAETNYVPSSSRQKVVLVFNYGFNNQNLLKHIESAGLKYFFLSYAQFRRWGSIEVLFEGETSSYLTLGQARLRLSDVAAVIWSPPWHALCEFDPPGLKKFPDYLFNHRWNQILRDLRRLVAKDALWLPSHPLNGSQHWQNKISEYDLALEAGLAVPPLVHTNDPAVAASFIDRHGGRALFREMSCSPWSFRNVMVTSDEVRSGARRIRRAPCTFQKYIEKQYEIRAVVIGDQVFPVKIDSQASKAARFDWRVYDNAHVRWERTKLPKAIVNSMLRVMKRLDLLWGSFDLIKGKDGEYYFLEVNRPGSVFWLKPFVGLDVPREIASYLKRRLS